jgi:hypothetical protein
LRDYRNDIHKGTFAVSDGSIEPLSFLQQGQYYRIVGSVFNDGVWKYGETSEQMQDETFDGSVWAMAVPPAVIALSAEIDDWIEANKDALNSPYQSESFGGYSYSKGGSYANDSNAAYGWRNQFASRLSPYRRISVL